MSNPNKAQLLAELIDGRVVEDPNRVAICIKGTVLGFPATLEAIGTTFPFGCNYFIETKVVEDPDNPTDPDRLQLTILPRVARGIGQFFARVLLFESKGQLVGDKRLEKQFVMNYNNTAEAQRFCQYPGVYEKLVDLHNVSKFSELLVKAESGLWLQQPNSFNSLTPETFKQTFKVLGDLGQILYDTFQAQ